MKKILKKSWIAVLVLAMALFLLPAAIYAEPTDSDISVDVGYAGETTELNMTATGANGYTAYFIIYKDGVMSPEYYQTSNSVNSDDWTWDLNMNLPKGNYMAELYLDDGIEMWPYVPFEEFFKIFHKNKYKLTFLTNQVIGKASVSCCSYILYKKNSTSLAFM